MSEPLLGFSMDLAQNESVVWDVLQRTATLVATKADIYAIACNTLNWYAPRMHALGLQGRLVCFQDALLDWLMLHKIKRIALLGAAPVTGLGPWSAYRQLADIIDIEVPTDADRLHDLILDVKRFGSAHPSLRPRFREIIESLSSPQVVLACTELPLIADIETSKSLIDVTELVADRLVNLSLALDLAVDVPDCKA